MDNLSLISFFICFSIWLVGLGIAFSINKNSNIHFRKEFIQLAIFFVIHILQDIVFVYIENTTLSTLSTTAEIYERTILIIIYSLIANRSVCLTWKYFEVKNYNKIRIIMNYLSIFFIVVPIAIFQFNAVNNKAVSIGFILILSFYILSFIFSLLFPFLFKKEISANRAVSILYSIVFFLNLLAFVEDHLLAIFEDVIVYPYVYILINIFFIWRILSISNRSEFPAEMQLKINKVANNFELSKRETEVLELLIEGFDKNRIGQVLSISVNTVKTHVSSIYRKLMISSRLELFSLIKNW